MNVLKFLLWVLIFNGNVLSLTYQVTAQSVPAVPFDVEFAGVTVHLNEQGRVKLQREVGRLYADRARLQQDIESLRQLTPLLEPLLKAARFPTDYRYAVLPFASNELIGYWGLTSNRALSLKMVVNDAVDERYHPIIATKTVISHLSRLQTTSNNYVLTLLRYMQDDSLADRLTDKTNSTYLLLDVQSPLLIWRSIARKLVFEREEPVLRVTQSYLLYEYQQSVGYSLRTISQQLKLDEERLRPFNTWLKANTIPDEKEYSVLIRVTADEFLTVKSRSEIHWKPSVVTQTDVGFPMLTKLPQSTVPTYESAVFYTINDRLGVQAQPCDNVITLAHYGKITIKTFLSYNELSGKDVVQPGQIYYLSQKTKRAKVPFHIVQKDQTLREIANIYGVRLKSLLRFNRIQPTQRVRTERVVWLRKKRPRRQPVEYRQVPVDNEKPVAGDSATIASVSPVSSPSVQPTTKPTPTTVGRTGSNPVRPTTKNVSAQSGGKEGPSSVDSEKSVKRHVVRPKQTYYGISKLYGITLQQLYAWNKLSERIPLRIGQELVVDVTKKGPTVPSTTRVLNDPKVGAKSAKVNEPALAVVPERIIYHVVRAGQTVYRVALINKVSVPDLMRWNNLKNYTIEVGQKLLVRKPE